MKLPSLGRTLTLAGATMVGTGAGCCMGALGATNLFLDTLYAAAEMKVEAEDALAFQTRCSPDKKALVVAARAIIYEDRERISRVFGEKCREEHIACSEEELQILIEESFGTPYAYCSSENRTHYELTEDSVYSMTRLGQTLAFATPSDVGAYTLFPMDFAQGPCSTMGTVLHEEGHVLTGMVHQFDKDGSLRRDWINLAGEAAQEVCEKERLMPAVHPTSYGTPQEMPQEDTGSLRKE